MSKHLTFNPEPDGCTAAGAWEQQGLEHKAMDEEQREKAEKQEEEVEANHSAALEPSTLTWPEDREKERGGEKGVTSDGGAEGQQERRIQESTGSQECLQGQESQPEGEQKTKWRNSMPEGDRWRNGGLEEGQVKQTDGTLADDEEDDDDDEETQMNWMPEKAAQVFTPTVIVRPSSKLEEFPLKDSHYGEIHNANNFLEPQMHTAPPVQYYPQWTEEPDHYLYVCGGCGDILKHGLGISAAAVLFPLLVWGGYILLPFDVPPVDSAPLRLVYTLRCSFFAVIPIMLGVLVLGVVRLRYRALNPLHDSKVGEEKWEVAVHRHYVGDSLSLFLLYFLQLAVMATYISQDLLKMVPLLTIVFAFGRLIYWVCASLGSSVRSVGFGLSFLPILVMLGANLYFVCVSLREGAVFDVAPPTTAPLPRQRWWG